jgi:hypothetical protein
MHTRPEEIEKRAKLRIEETGHGEDVESDLWKKWATDWYEGDQFKKVLQFKDKLELVTNE